MDREGEPDGAGVEGRAPLGALLRASTIRLARAGIEDAPREARLLLALALGIAPERLLALGPAAPVAPRDLEALLARRADSREPMAYIEGRRGFWTLELEVSRETLIPRPDTETLIALALARLPDRARVRRVLDLGTGTGALLLAALAEFDRAHGIGIDREGACRLARRNARLNRLDRRAAFLAGDWLAAIRAGGEGFDLILSNPPYVESGAIAGLMPEVSRHEPRAALDGGADGLDAYRAILPGLASRLAPGGRAVLEIGSGQAEAVGAIASGAGLRLEATRADLGGIQRALCLAAA